MATEKGYDLLETSTAYDISRRGWAFTAGAKVCVKSLGFTVVGIVAGLVWVGEKVSHSRAERWKQIVIWYLGWAWQDILIAGGRLFHNTYGRCIFQVNPVVKDENRVILTIDDCPGDSPEEMGRLLDVLKKHGVRATFFCTTDLINKGGEAMRNVMRRIVGEGHELGNHMPEDKPYDRMGAEELERELLRAEDTLAQFTPRSKIVWFRPPMGKVSRTMLDVVPQRYPFIAIGDVFSSDPFVGGNVDPPSRSSIQFHVQYNLRHAKPGSILILHVPNRSMRRQTTAVLDELIPALRAKGLHCVRCCDFQPAREGNGGVVTEVVEKASLSNE